MSIRSTAGNIIKKFVMAVFLLSEAGGARAQISYDIPFPRPVRELNDTVTLSIIGDVMMHARQLEYDHSSFLSNISHALKSADFSIANMEFSMGGAPFTGYPAFSTPDWYAEYVADCGVDVFLLANNHILDRGSTGFERTMEVYGAMPVMTTGAASDQTALEECYPLILKSHGLKIALLNFTYGSNNGSSREWPKLFTMKKDEIHAAFERARQRGADYVIALPHWGVEYELEHSSSQEKWAEWLVSEGADAIVGTHPHVVQDTTHINKVPVIYSIGNAVSNMSLTNTRLELEVRLKFVRNFLTGEKHFLEPELRFMWCTLPNMLTRSYSTIFVDEWEGRRNEWITPADYDNMIQTRQRVKAATGIE